MQLLCLNKLLPQTVWQKAVTDISVLRLRGVLNTLIFIQFENRNLRAASPRAHHDPVLVSPALRISIVQCSVTTQQIKQIRHHLRAQ